MATCIWISTSDNSFSTAANWSTGAVPVAGDTIVFDGTGTAAMTGGLNQSAVAFAAIYCNQANAAQIGSLSAAGVAAYFQHAAPLVFIGQRSGNGSPAGSSLILMDSGATACTYTIADSASTAAVNANLPPIQLKGTALTLNGTGGNVGIAVRAGETSTLALGAVTSGQTGKTVQSPSLYLGQGVTVTTLRVDTGYVLSRATNTEATVTVTGGTYDYQGTGAHTTLSVNAGGTAYYSGTGTITTLNNSGTFDRTRDGRTVTITNTNLYAGAKFLLDNGVSGSTVRTNPPVLQQCGMADVAFSSPAGDLI